MSSNAPRYDLATLWIPNLARPLRPFFGPDIRSLRGRGFVLTLALALAWTSALSFGLIACSKPGQNPSLPPVQTVKQVNLDRYLGTWYEIASFPQRFQRGCTATTATYSLRKNGTINVDNRCHIDRVDGPEKQATGRARVVDKVSQAKLKVSFFRPFWGNYWIIDLDPNPDSNTNYQYAVVGDPSRAYLWILSRQPTLDAATYEQILSRLREQHYDVSKLRRTIHAPTH